MPSTHSKHMESPSLFSLLRHTTAPKKSSKGSGGSGGGGSKGKGGGGLLRMFKLLPMLTTGCKMAALLGSLHRKPLLTDRATTVTLFGYRKARLCLAIQEDPHRPPVFVVELPMLTTALHREMASDMLRIALETETRSHKKRLLEEYVWAVYCNGRKVGYSIRRKNMSEEEAHVMQLLRGVSMGAGVLPSLSEKESAADGELTYIRARFDRVVGSKDSESFYMINPEGASSPQELSIFFLRLR
ncbi:protein MIZU-KUSSEI 1-like [Salvia splendens]|nr:protein MIZU-KUSSEI 1-like [Salvia splendens]